MTSRERQHGITKAACVIRVIVACVIRESLHAKTNESCEKQKTDVPLYIPVQAYLIGERRDAFRCDISSLILYDRIE
jgi:hypothetical protein